MTARHSQLRTFHSTVVVGDHLYLWGGRGAVCPPDVVETLNIRNLKWQQKSTTGKPPLGRLRYACTAVNGNIYYFGGNCKPSECFHNCVFELNTEVLHWREVVPDVSSGVAPIKKHGCGMAHFVVDGNDRLVLFGGVGPAPVGAVIRDQYSCIPRHSEFVYTNEVHMLPLNQSPAQWTVPSVSGSLPPPCAYFTLVCIFENKFLLFGGIDSELGQTNNLYLLSLENETIHVEKVLVSSKTSRVDLPKRRISHAATSFNTDGSEHACSHLLVLGGLDNDFETISDCWIFDFAHMTWSKVVLPDCVSERFDHSVSAFLVSAHCIWMVTVGGLAELDSTRMLNPATEPVAMFELVYIEGRWVVGTVATDLRELKHAQRMLVDRLLEGRRISQQRVVKKKITVDQSLTIESRPSAASLECTIEQNYQPHWVINTSEITLTSERVGDGAFGTISVAVFRGMKVAAKRIHDLIISDYTIQLFMREMDIISKVCHPNIVQFLGATRVENPILLFELMPASLCEVLHKGPLSRQQTVGISTQISYALAYLHLNKPFPIIHRDVSSPNILLEPLLNDAWKAKLSDFGSANLQSHTKTCFPGNLAYSAPEVESVVCQTPAMDIYSLGVVTMEMSLHQLPCRTVFDRLEQARRIEWPSLQAIVVDCISDDYHKRPSSSTLITLLRNLHDANINT